MHNQLDEKRRKFLKQIRARHHEQYFDLHRLKYIAELPAVAYIPILIQNQLYDDLLLIMDAIQVSNQIELDSKILSIIEQRSQHHSDPKIRAILFILKNRLGKWTQKQIKKAADFVEKGDQSFIKQLAIYLQVKFIKISTQLQLAKLQQTKQPIYISYCQQLSQIFDKILHIHPKCSQIRLCWLDIICRTLQLNISTIPNCLPNIDSFLLAIDIGVNNVNQFQLLRVLKIIVLLAQSAHYTNKIIEMECFSKILQFIFNGSIDVLVEGLQIVAQLMSQDEIVIKKIVQKYKIVQLLKKYLNHLMIGVQIRILWAFSNIAGSQQYPILLQNQQILCNIFQKTTLQTNIQVRFQAYYCILNLISNSNNSIMQKICNYYPTVDTLIRILQQILEPTVKSMLLQRALYALYHLLSQYPIVWVRLDQFGVKKILEKLYEGQKQANKIKMIDQAIQIYQKSVKEGQNYAQKL